MLFPWNKYPYTDFHELNDSWILATLKELINQVENFVSINAIKYADPIQWDITRQYEKNTIVIDPLTGTAYISVAPVPIGVQLNRPEYWTVVFDLGSFVTKAAKNFTSRYEEATTTTATFNTNAGEWLVWGDELYVANVNITAGDTYVVNSNITRITIEEIIATINGVLTTLTGEIGDLNDLATTNKSNLVVAINELVSENDFVTPEMFGAVGDGVTDDTAAVQSALDSDKNVKLLGSYLITSDLVIKHTTTGSEDLRQIIYGGKLILQNVSIKGNTTFCGAVFYNVLFTSDGHYTKAAIVTDSKLTRTKFILCKFKDIDYPIMDTDDASEFNQETTFVQCHFQNGVNAITLRRTTYCLKVIDCNINSFSGIAIQFGASCVIRSALISGNTIELCGTGIKIGYSVRGLLIKGCYFEANNAAIDLTYLETDANGSTSGFTISECHIDFTNDKDNILLPYVILHRLSDYVNGTIIPIVFDRLSGFTTTIPSTMFKFPNGTPSAYTLDFKFNDMTPDVDVTYFHQYDVHTKTIFYTLTADVSAGGNVQILSYTDLQTEMGRSARPSDRSYAPRAGITPFFVFESANNANVYAHFPLGATNGQTISYDVIYK